MQPDFNEKVLESVESRTSRAVVTETKAGERADCEYCGENVGYRAKVTPARVVCNIYIAGAWDHTETFHPDCYVDAKAPYGPVLEGKVHGVSRLVIAEVINGANLAVQARESA